MTRAWPLLLALLCGCFDFDQAVVDYKSQPLVCSAGKTSCADGMACDDASCRLDADCCSGQCIAGSCRPSGTFADGECSELNDCPADKRCSPGSTGYRCVSVNGCQPAGTLCSQSSDCCAGDCSSCSRECRNGLCQVGSCGRDDAGCATSTSCCDGFQCRQSTGTCSAAPTGFDNGSRCELQDQCTSNACSANGQCIAPTGAVKGVTCTGSCSMPYQCLNSRCCLGLRERCLKDDTCCSNRCVGGYCAEPGLCRRAGTGCAKTSDCCDGGVCDAVAKKCG